MKRRLLLAAPALTGVIFLTTLLPFPKSKLGPETMTSLRLLDRNGVLLREVLSDEGGRCLWVRLEDVSPYLLKATIAAEDKLFFFHHGVNGLSVLRALVQNLRHGEVVSGASTITQQVVRALYPARRNLWVKLREAWLALRLERTLSKPEILCQYINRISYGNQAHGIEAASRLYLDKPSSQLSLAEAAYLAAIPRSPSRLNPYRSPGALKKRQAFILARMSELGLAARADCDRARTEELCLRPAEETFRAPHFCDFVLAQIPAAARKDLIAVETTIDHELQQKVEILLKNNLGQMNGRGAGNGAAVVIDNRNGEILSLVGSRDFFDEAGDGQVNGVLALRQPGSTLKPFTYGLALERGLTAASIIDDSPAQFRVIESRYRPQNYDRRYHGPISLRAALACSYNIPAVALLQQMGPDLLFRRLRSLGFNSLTQDPGYYGVGLTLGNGEVSLLELAAAYSALARQGLYLRPRPVVRLVRKGGREDPWPSPEAGERVFSPQVAYIITDVLADRDARMPSFGYHNPLAFPFPVAAKTGTSKDFRDNWTVGFSPRYTVAVWAGNFDGRPMPNVSGVSGCGPLFRAIMLLLHKGTRAADFPEPEGVVRSLVCPRSGLRPNAFCPGAVEEVFIEGTEPREPCSLHRKEPGTSLAAADANRGPRPWRFEISFPRDGDVFKLDPVLRPEHQRLKLRVAVPPADGVVGVEWWVNGEKVGDCGPPHSIFWNLRPGSYTIRATAVRDGLPLESPPVKIVVLT